MTRQSGPEPSADTALIIVDAQTGLDNPVHGRRNNPRAEANMARLLEAWRMARQPLFHVQHLSLDPSSTLAMGTAGTEIKAEVRPEPGEPVIQKHVNSAFIGTDLEKLLRAAGIEKVVIAGLTTNHCVETTTRMAANLGFDTYLVSDGCATFDRAGPDGAVHMAEDIHAMTMANLHEEFATIVTTDEILGARQAMDR